MRPGAAAIQMAGPAGSPDDSRARSVRLAGEAADAGARLVVLPELAISGYTVDRRRLEAAAEPLHGATLAAWHDLAQRRELLVAGGFCERDGDRLYNSAVLVGPGGLLLHYRKLHLFDAEKLVFTPGDAGLGVARTALGTIGLCVCYDLRFVEVMRALALQGADIVAVPTAWVRGFDPNPRDATGLIGQARGVAVQANLNQVYVICASMAGEDGDIAFLGSSLIADPFGRIAAGPMDDAGEAALVGEIDPDMIVESRHRSERITPRTDRRRDVYGIRIGGEVL